ncbi:MAG: thioredoxin family protein [Polyangiales bacterium]
MASWGTCMRRLLLILALTGCARAPRAPAADPWALRSDEALDQEITRARAEARAGGRRVLLEFVAPWCDDCREMTRLEETAPAREVLARRYVRVRVNVGAFDRHTALLRRFGVTRIAHYVVLDPATGERVAQTTMEPITRHEPLSSARWAAWLEAPAGP